MRPLQKNKKSPINSKAEGKREGGRGRKLCRETYPINVKAPGTKKSARGRGLVSCSGTLLLLNDEVVDKLFGF